MHDATPCSSIHCTSLALRVLRRVPGRVVMRVSATVLGLALLLRASVPVRADDPPPNLPAAPPAVVVPAPLATVPTPTLAPPTLAPGATTKPDFHDAASSVDVYAVLTDDMFPTEWHDPDVAVSAQPLATSERDRLIRLMKIALSKYPPELLKASLSRVYLVGGLRFEGIDAAATNSATCLYIEDEADNPRYADCYTDRFIEDSFHHEFAHLLQRSYREQWEPKAWIDCNPRAFSYREESGVEAVRSGKDSEEPTDEWNRQGFLCEYGAADAAEDFATIAADLLIGDDDFWRRADKFPALKAKINVAISFYVKLDDRFNEAYFRSLRPGIAYVPPPTLPATLTASATSAAPTNPATPPPAAPGSTDPAAKP